MLNVLNLNISALTGIQLHTVDELLQILVELFSIDLHLIGSLHQLYFESLFLPVSVLQE